MPPSTGCWPDAHCSLQANVRHRYARLAEHDQSILAQLDSRRRPRRPRTAGMARHAGSNRWNRHRPEYDGGEWSGPIGAPQRRPMHGRSSRSTTTARLTARAMPRCSSGLLAARSSGGVGAHESATGGSGSLQDEGGVWSLTVSPKIEEPIGEQRPPCDEVIRRQRGRVEFGKCQDAVSATRGAEAAGCGAVTLLLEPLGCESDALAKPDLTKGAAQLLPVVIAHRSRRSVRVELDRLVPRWTDERECFGHADLPPNVDGEEVGWRSLSPRMLQHPPSNGSPDTCGWPRSFD